MSAILSIMGFGLTQMNFLLKPGILLLFGVVAPLFVGLISTMIVTKKIKFISLLDVGHE